MPRIGARTAPRKAQPFKPGQILGKIPVSQANLDSDSLTDAERAVIEAVGADPANPPDLSKAVGAAGLTRQYLESLAVANTVTDEERAAITPKRPVTVPTPVDVSKLPAAEQAEIQKLLVRHQRQERAATQRSTMPAKLATIPGMTEAWNVAQQNEPTIKITEAPPRPAGFSPAKGKSPYVDEVAAPAAKRVAVPEPEPEPAMELEPEPAMNSEYEPQQPDAGAGTAPHNNFCPHCGFDQEQPAVEITEMDKSSYLQEAILGGKRFRKEYMLYGDRVRVVFRDLKPIEATHARMQAEKDVMSGEVSGMLGMMERVTSYRTAMAIESIQRGNADVQEFEEGITLIKANGPAVLKQIMEYFDEHVFHSDTFKKAIGLEHSRFSKLLETLEARASRSDF